MKQRAFTLVELLVLAVLALLVLTLLPALARTRPNSQAWQCLNNARQMCAAWRMYADNSRDAIVYASDDGSGAGHPLNQYAWTASHMDFNGANQANWNTAVDIMVRPLWPYTGNNAAIYRCPSDRSFVTVSGIVKPRVRSISMNAYLGGFAETTGWPYVSSYRIFRKTTDLSLPGPANVFVFMDERPDVINWGDYLTDMTGYSTQPSMYQFGGDMPGMYHNLGATISFADGRAEIKRWADPRTTPPPGSVSSSTYPSPGNVDIAWIQDHATRPK